MPQISTDSLSTSLHIRLADKKHLADGEFLLLQHTYIHKYIHTYIHMYIHTYIYIYILEISA